MRMIMKIFNTKKGQGLSMNVIIIAALALVVMVVLMAIFTGRIGSFGKGVDSSAFVGDPLTACEEQTFSLNGNDANAGHKVSASGTQAARCESNEKSIFAGDLAQGQICCIDIK